MVPRVRFGLMSMENSVTTPFNRVIDMASGVVEPKARVVRRRLFEMRDAFQQEPPRDEPVYEVHNIDVPDTNDHILTSTTILLPGKVGNEYFMTKGHFHEVRGRAEFYFGIAGSGLLLSATEAGDHNVQEIRPGTLTYVPGGWAHRSINTG